MNIKYIICIFLLALAKLAVSQEISDQNLSDEYVQISLTVKVLDENGEAINNADIHVRAIYPERYKDGSNDFYGKSNQAGEFAVESKTTSYSVPIFVKKDGYYDSVMEYQYGYELNRTTKAYDRVMPWNPIVPVIMKKIGKRVPMYVRSRDRDAKYFPKQDIEYGFDLMKDDWVYPHGKGVLADLLLKSELFQKDESSYNVIMTIRFPNKGDGWIPIMEMNGVESDLKYPREAPATGYREEPIILKQTIRKPAGDEIPQGGHAYGYFFRTRTKLGEQGEVMSSLYSKIVDIPIDKRRLKHPIFIGGSPGNPNDPRERKGCFFILNYYLNPAPNNRIVEFDRKNNLATEVDIPAGNLAP